MTTGPRRRFSRRLMERGVLCHGVPDRGAGLSPQQLFFRTPRLRIAHGQQRTGLYPGAIYGHID